MPEFTVNFEVFCNFCGKGLCNYSDTRISKNRNYPQVTVDPCPDCMKKANEDGYNNGYEHGFTDGYEKGREDTK